MRSRLTGDRRGRARSHSRTGVTAGPESQQDRSHSRTGVTAGGDFRAPNELESQTERQFDHIKQGLEDRGRSEKIAREIASRTVNKARARPVESAESSRTSTEDISSGRRGGLRSHRGSGGRTRAQLYQAARRRNIRGRSKMRKSELAAAIGIR